MNNFKNILGTYINGNYKVILLKDGTKIRYTKENDFKPDFAENCDIKITDECDGACPFCYEGCSINGKHARLMNEDGTPYWNFMNDLKPYTELAVNGNDLSHPELEDFLKFLKNKKVIANITVNQKHFMRNIEKLHRWSDEHLIYGLGVSLNNPEDERFKKELIEFPNAVIHTIAGILTEKDIDNLTGNGFENKFKLLILGYKTLKRGITYAEQYHDEIERNRLFLLNNEDRLLNCFKVVSFDNLALEQLKVKDTLFNDNEKKWDTFYMGDDGTMTFYIDLVKGQYAKNSCMEEDRRMSIGEKTVIEMFNNIR